MINNCDIFFSLLNLNSFFYSLLQTEQNSCIKCGETIADQFLMAVGGHTWHADCLRCCICSTVLGDTMKCYMKHNEVYCKEDYTK